MVERAALTTHDTDSPIDVFAQSDDTPKARAEFVKSGVLFADGLLDLGQLAARFRMDEATCDAVLSEPSVAESIEAEFVAARTDGRLAKARGHALLLSSLERLSEALTKEDASPNMALRVGEFAHRVSGLGQEKPAAAGPSQGFQIQIVNDEAGRFTGMRLGFPGEEGRNG